MSTEIKFFSSYSRNEVYSFNLQDTAASNLQFSNRLRGSGNGSFDMKADSSTQSLLSSISKNIYFIAILEDGDIISAGVTEAAVPVEETHSGAWTVTYYGFWEHLEGIAIYSSYKAGQFGSNVRIGPDDTSWEKTINAASPMRLFGAVMRELRINMQDSSASPFWSITGYGTDTSNSSSSWNKVYELSSVEFPTVASILNDVLDDESCDPVEVTPVITGGQIRWNISFLSGSRNSVQVNLEEDPVGEIEWKDHMPTTAARSFMRSDDRNGTVYISNVQYSSNAAYSTFVPDDTTTSVVGAGIATLNQNKVNEEANIAGGLRWKTTDVEFATVGTVYQTTLDGSTIVGVCTEAVRGTNNNYEAELTITSSSNAVNKFRKPSQVTELERAVGNPLSNAQRNSRKGIMRSSRRPTGWRTP